MKFLAIEISMLKAFLLIKAILFTCALKANSLSKSNTNKLQTINTKNHYLLSSNTKELLSLQTQTQTLSSLIIEEKEVLVLKENSSICDEPGYLCPYGFTCRKDPNFLSSKNRCIKGRKYTKEHCTGEFEQECAEGLYCQYSERLAKLINNGIIRLTNFHDCQISEEKILTLPYPKLILNNYNNQQNDNFNLENKNCNLINHVCPIGTYCKLNKDFNYVCELGNKKENEQCLSKNDYCSENLVCSAVTDIFEKSIGKRLLAGNFACKKVETEVSKLIAGFKYFLEECEKDGIYGKNTCMFSAYCDKTYEDEKSVCLRGKKKLKDNCDAKILPGNEIDCQNGLECKCVGQIFKTCLWNP